eukprot:1232768-Pleurochrysis_carterae.AAC.1
MDLCCPEEVKVQVTHACRMQRSQAAFRWKRAATQEAPPAMRIHQGVTSCLASGRHHTVVCAIGGMQCRDRCLAGQAGTACSKFLQESLQQSPFCLPSISLLAAPL